MKMNNTTLRMRKSWKPQIKKQWKKSLKTQFLLLVLWQSRYPQRSFCKVHLGYGYVTAFMHFNTLLDFLERNEIFLLPPQEKKVKLDETTSAEGEYNSKDGFVLWTNVYFSTDMEFYALCPWEGDGVES